MKKILNISIVLYNSDYTLITNLVKTLRGNTWLNQIYLIDNSPKLNVEFQTCDAYYIFNVKNLGYGAGHNLAIQKSIKDNVKYHLILNPDIQVKSNDLDNLLEQMESHNDIGLLMPKIIYPDGSTQYLCKLLPNPADLIGRRFIPLKKWVKNRNIRYELRFTNYDKIMQVPSLSGCFMLIRTEVFEKVDGFDEQFFLYCEDLDLCRRIGEVSQTVFYPEVSVIHDYEKGSYKNKKLLLLHIISAIKYFNKWGWFFDRKRKLINSQTLKNFGYYNHLEKNHSS